MTDAAPDGAERLRALGSCAVSDALDTLGLSQAVSSLRQLTIPNATFAGRAVTVELAEASGANSGSHLGADAVDRSGAGDVIVVANAGRTQCAGWGGLLSTAAARNGIEGVIVDGAVRDVDEAREVGLPVLGLRSTPVTARGRVAQTSWGQPVEFCGVVVQPGDWVLADGSGVVIVPQDRLDEVIATASTVAAAEARLAEEIVAGRSVADVMNHRYELMLTGGDT